MRAEADARTSCVCNVALWMLQLSIAEFIGSSAFGNFGLHMQETVDALVEALQVSIAMRWP